ncbi:filamentous hemagglutinin, partial [Chroococcidiopsis cubana CCALA 043]
MSKFLDVCIILSFPSISLSYLLAVLPTLAQVVPDNTLPINSIVRTEGENSSILGGTKAGNNLFHSFEQFSIPTGNTAYLNNALDIQNIFSRVTGSFISNIDGLIRANGTANLFLLNPNGIIFGPNAKLDLGGSFIGSTASRIEFADGVRFSATSPEAPPLLTVDVPVGLGFGSNPGRIVVQGKGHSLVPLFAPLKLGERSTGLRVELGKTLALVGGDLSLDGGIAAAEGGSVALGSVASGEVSLIQTSTGWSLDYQGVKNFKDIHLSRQALVDASGAGGGSIQLQGGRVTLADGSLVLIQNRGIQPAGNISVNATESLEESGTASNSSTPSSLFSETVGLGNGADISVSTKRLSLQGGGRIYTKTFTPAKAGNITVLASDSLQLNGFSPVNPLIMSAISTFALGTGNTGSVQISTGKLTALDGGYVSSTTYGSGTGGDVSIDASDSIQLIGANLKVFAPSVIGASTFSTGKAGNVTINTPSLEVLDGGRVNASTLASGAAGSVTINASNSVKVSGITPGSRNPSLIDSSANIVDEITRPFLGAPPVPSGTSGDVTIKTKRLNVSNSGQVSVRNDGLGNAGKLQIEASSIELDNQGGITAATASGEGGNIFLNSQNLQLRDGSSISATAGLERGGGNGGNITIDTDTLAALNGSSITANAFTGRGGNIRISTAGIFQSPDSIFDASSQFGVDGTVEVRNLGLEPDEALVPY